MVLLQIEVCENDSSISTNHHSNFIYQQPMPRQHGACRVVINRWISQLLAMNGQTVLMMLINSWLHTQTLSHEKPLISIIHFEPLWSNMIHYWALSSIMIRSLTIKTLTMLAAASACHVQSASCQWPPPGCIKPTVPGGSAHRKLGGTTRSLDQTLISSGYMLSPSNVKSTKHPT